MACFSGQRIKLAGQQTIDTQITYNRYTKNKRQLHNRYTDNRQ
jgi:hypothetical protein